MGNVHGGALRRRAVAGCMLVAASCLVALAPQSAPASARHADRAPAHVRLLPDMRPLAAQDLSVQQRPGRRMLRFETGLANVGPGPMEARSDRRRQCPPGQRHASQVIYRDRDGNQVFKRSVDTAFTRRSAGCMLFHPSHDHWHFEAAARYALFKPDRRNAGVVRTRKMSFCLRDSERVPDRFGQFHQPLYYDACGRDLPQGISTGWVDVYSSDLPGQALRLPPRIGNGVYCLAVRVDPRDELRESDETNNISYRALRLRGQHVRPGPKGVCAP